MLLTLLLIAGGTLAVRFMDGSRGAQMAIVALGLAFVLAVHLTLPAEAPLRRATGGSLTNWLILGAVVAVILAYRWILQRLRARAERTATTGAPDANPGAATPDRLSPAELDRYARHIVLREVGGPGQQRLRRARVLVIGAGGLGAPVLHYLAAAGVGTIGVIDDDVVSASNLQRQVLFRDDQIGMPKVFAAQANLRALNPFVEVLPYNRRLTAEIAPDLFADFDLILDGTDTFATRYMVNAAAVAARKPLVSGAIGQWEGQVSLFDSTAGAPCYACLFPEAPADGLAPSCAEAGVVGALPGIVGSIMAAEAIKHIVGAGRTLTGRMLIFDALYGETRTLALDRRPDCAICGERDDQPDTDQADAGRTDA